MSLALDDLPRDPEWLLQQLQHMTEVVAAERSRISALEFEHATALAERDAVLAERDAAQAEIEKLRLLIRQLQRGQFGRRSERLDPDQLQLGLEDLEQTVAAAEAAQEEVAARSSTPRPPRVRHRNLGALPAHLPRIEVLVDVEDKICPCCGGSLHAIGEDTSEMLDVVPAVLRVKVIRRPRYGCRACETAVVQAPAPERPISGGMATEALLAHVLVAKYGDFLPLYRQAGIFARQGVELDRSTLCDWVGRACWWLEPLWRLLHRHVMASTRIFADDTTLPVLDPGRGRTKTGRLWGYAIDDRPWGGSTPPAVVYLYAEDRKGEHPAAHLAGFEGILQVDGYSGFKRLLENRPPGAIRLAFCWSQTIRTQSDVGRHGGAGRAINRTGIAQRDDMADFQRVFVDDDALDDELQDSLAVAEVGILEPRADPFAERGHVRQHGMSTNALFDQAAALVALLDAGAMLFGNRPTPLSQLLEADHFSLVSLEQPLVGPCQAVEPGLELTRHRLILWAPVRRLGNEALELGNQPLRVAEQADDVVPHRLLDHLGIDHRPRAFGVAPGRQRIDAGAAVVATLNSASRPSKAAAVDGEPTDATLQQAA